MIKRTKKDVLEFIYSTAGPIGPWVFAGFGTEIEQRLADAPGSFDTILDEWVRPSDGTALLRVLEEICLEPALEEEYALVKAKFTEDWEYVIVSLMYSVCENNESLYQQLRMRLDGVDSAKSIMLELQAWWNERV